MKVIIIEDQAPAQRLLKTYISKYDELSLELTTNDPVEALTYLKKNADIDIIFLDIHLPKLSGLELLELLPSYKYVILTTAFDKYAISGFNYNVVDYLLKPFPFERFSQAIDKVIKLENGQFNQKSNQILVKIDGYMTKIDSGKIIYIKSDGDYTFVYFRDSRKIVSLLLKFWEQELSPQNFTRIHKSYIVNLAEIDKISYTTVHINSMELPIGRVYKKRLMDAYNG